MEAYRLWKGVMLSKKWDALGLGGIESLHPPCQRGCRIYYDLLVRYTEVTRRGFNKTTADNEGNVKDGLGVKEKGGFD